ncbi:synapse-associated protein of 47 kDa isoform X2 [Temnothorax curvispinosus]|uniref:Synapse-associated protein of 47 kDa isoform X2 n=1 Tax=Temnothorax curvispinosus TaxID=300111 RepID=A0A6J1QJM3_9HYME|nr:synapse-associated protein of 47 kDa isoform X2 [Temnothorax curvispinosus]
MFSGLTNQVSNWMGKKPENGSEATPEEPKPLSPDVETGADLEKKNNTSPKGNKLEMFAGVKNQMSGWLSGGIPGLSRGAGAAEGEAPPPTETEEDQPQETEDPVGEQIKDDDASSATGGADSGPASLEGTPTDDKNGQQAFGAVSTKALAGAKSLGGFLYSAVNKAGKTVVEASVKIKKTVEENRLIAELNKEQEAFIAGKQAGEKGEAVAPWVGAPNEDALREECLSLSTDRRNFVRAPPPGVEFAWDFEAVQPMAQATLALDPNLEAMRFELVPKVISEENFWRNYFYRVSLLRQGYELNAMASQQEEESNPNQTLASTDSIDHTQAYTYAHPNPSSLAVSVVLRTVQMTTGQTTTTGVTTASSNSALADSPGHEFVSDTMRVSDTDLEEVREGMKKLGMQPPKEEDWERELEAELKDYEVVTGSNSGGSGQERSVATATKDIAVNDNDWEKQIDELLANEDDEDLK